MGNFLEKNVTEAGKGLNEYAAFHLMQDGHKSLNDLLFVVQEALDQKQNIHVKPQKAKFPEERARQAAQSLEDVTVPEETIRRRARSATSNILTSFQDDYIQENANFRTNAGLNCYVLRTGASKCCDWCAGVAGRYASKKAPNGFWRRHDNCTCQITYETQKSRQRLSGGSGKGWQVTDEVRRRQAQRIAYKPTKLTHEQAKKLEQKNLQYTGLTNGTKQGIIEESKDTKTGTKSQKKANQKSNFPDISSDADFNLFKKLGNLLSPKAKNEAENKAEAGYDESLKRFSSKLQKLKNQKVANIFKKEISKKDTFAKSTVGRNYFSHTDKKVYLSSVASPSTIAHELFHKIDFEHGISKSGRLDECIKSDYAALEDRAKAYKKSIANMLYSEHPEAFERKRKMKNDFRGVSDILNGMTNGNLWLGYGHKENYWENERALQKETFAQYGRFYFDENQSVFDMVADIFPETTKTIKSIIEEIDSTGR